MNLWKSCLEVHKNQPFRLDREGQGGESKENLTPAKPRCGEGNDIVRETRRRSPWEWRIIH